MVRGWQVPVWIRCAYDLLASLLLRAICVRHCVSEVLFAESESERQKTSSGVKARETETITETGQTRSNHWWQVANMLACPGYSCPRPSLLISLAQTIHVSVMYAMLPFVC
jgi:hypothetical protein